VAVTVGLLSAASLLVGLPLVPFWGAWADRYSRKLIIVRSAVVEALLFLLIAFVQRAVAAVPARATDRARARQYRG
jgi:MFS family permease